jgi:hypothetical protein
MAIIKYIILSILISYLLRQLMSPFLNQPQTPRNPPQNPPTQKQNPPKKFSDKLGDYTDYEELK